MPKETYVAARQRLLGEFLAIGFQTSAHTLKVPWVQPRGGEWRLWFKPQAIYLNQHSLYLDMRGMSAEQILESVRRSLA